jgi:hypothetical protein
MKAEGIKIGCTVRSFKTEPRYRELGPFKTLAHIVETPYDDRFSVWYGTLSPDCTPQEFKTLCQVHEAVFLLEDGRMGVARLRGPHGQYPAFDDKAVGDECKVVYFVGLSLLKGPPTPPPGPELPDFLQNLTIGPR